MFRPNFPLFVCALPMMFAACSSPIDTSAASPVASLDAKRVALDKEWRDALRFGADSPPILDLGPHEAGDALRLGVLPFGATIENAHIDVYIGARRVKRVTIPQTPEWSDIRIEAAGGRDGDHLFLDMRNAGTLWLSHCEVTRPKDTRPNVLVFLVDTLRRDHVGCYGYARATSPNIDALAAESVRFERCMAQSSWTKPSVATLLTSTWPQVHGAEDRPDVMRQDLPTLAKALERAGYNTQAFFTNINVLPLWGFGNEFARCVDVDSTEWQTADDARPIDAAIDAIHNAKGRPWFLYVHTMGPHDPYAPPAPYDVKFASDISGLSEKEAKVRRSMDRYDGEIANTDAQFGRLIQMLKDERLYDNTLIVVVSDHGEEFLDHGGEFHARTLYEEVVGVPLIVKPPLASPGAAVVPGLVRVIDIAPTILELVGAEAEPRFQGESFAVMMRDPTLDSRTGFASLFDEAISMRAAATTRYKFIDDRVAAKREWFDLVSDPHERQPIFVAPPEGAPLERFAARVAGIGAEGLHVLITCGDNQPRKVSGRVESAGLRGYEFHYYEWKGSATRDGDSVTFSIHTQDPQDHALERDVWHNERAEQDHARLVARIDPAKPVKLTITVDGGPIDIGRVHLGANAAHAPLDHAALAPLDIVARADAFDPAALPREFGVYVWYVPPADTRDIEQLDDATREALRGLGYLQ
ncbi:MAG: sulfatase [Candidatus Hydrogenedentota bacterium]